MRHFFSLWLILSCLSFKCYSQIMSEDSLYNSAKEYVFSGNYNKGIELFKILIKEFPANQEYKIFLGKAYGWKGEYDTAISVLTPIALQFPPPVEALEALINVHLWSSDYQKVISYCDIGLKLNIADLTFFQLKKAIALEKTNKDESALMIISEILLREDHGETQALKTQIYKKKRNAIAVSYFNTSFVNSDFEPWHLAYIEYKRNFTKIPVVARTNYGNMLSKTALQVDLDLYPSLGHNSYLYLNAGIAEGTHIFPGFKGGIEIFKNFRRNTISLGLRYLHFRTSHVPMFTGQITGNMNKWDFTYRPYLLTLNQAWYPSHIIGLKKSNEIKESFFQIDFQYGIIPYHFFVTNEFVRINSTRFGLQYQFRLKNSIFIRPIIMYEYEAYYPGKYRNRFNSQIIITKRF